jgi:hypothetical protein
MKLSIVLAFSLLGLAAQAGDIEIKSSQIALVIPTGDLTFPDTDACYPGQTLGAPHFTISRVMTKWSGEGTLRPNLIKIEIPATENSTKYECTYTSPAGNDSISEALGFAKGDIDKGAAQAISAESACSFSCGNFAVTDLTKAVHAKGTIKLYGIQTKIADETPVEVQVSAEDTFDLDLIP